MLTIKDIVVKNMQKITIIMVVMILFLSTGIQFWGLQQMGRQNALRIFGQVEQILDENSRELAELRQEYNQTCLNDAKTAAYILEYNPAALHDLAELKSIAANLEVDEIHIFNTDGVIVAGTHPEYYGYSFESGEQMAFFKPLLNDKTLELVQDIAPNTAEGKMVQYSALWSDDGSFIVQVGMYPVHVLKATRKNELSHIFSLLRTGVGYSLYAIDPITEKVIGSTVLNDVGKDLPAVGFSAEKLAAGKGFYAQTADGLSYCLAKEIDENYVIWTMPLSNSFRSIFFNELLLLAGLVLIAIILVKVVSNTMNRTVVEQIQRVNRDLRVIQNEGDLKTRVEAKGSKEFFELSEHINGMVASLLQSSEKLELSEQVRQQKETLEIQKKKLEVQHEQLENALESAEAANKAKSEFLFNMSHDIRTPMNAILGFTNLALESHDYEKQRDYLEDIDISAKQMLDLLNNILELSKIERHQIILEEELINVKETFCRIYKLFDSDLQKRNLSFSSEMDIQHAYMYLDKTHYSQILMNIMSNAIKYTPAGGTIKVSFRELPGEGPDSCRVETVVEDNGIGMSAKFLAQAYESFARERNSTVSGIKGTGLGLIIVKNLVNMMSGTINIESRQGQGTKVTIVLPHKLGEAPASAKQVQAEECNFAGLEGKYILLAEDIDINAVIAIKLLEGQGCLVDRAKDGVECVDMLLKAPPGYYDLVLMDIQMPNMDGYTATKTIRAFEDKKKANIPILAITANTFQEDLDKALASGMNGYIAKPLDTNKMFKAIADGLCGA